MTVTALPVGAKLGRYEIVSRLGSGGMGEVYRARDTTLRRDVAIKVLRSDALGGEAERREFAARMINEARAAAALSHPNVVAIYDVGETSDGPYIVFELVDGRMLHDRMREARHGLETRWGWLLDLARGLCEVANTTSCPKVYGRPGARTGDSCKGFRLTVSDASLYAGTLECDLCGERRVFTGETGKPCSGLHARDGKTYRGALDCVGQRAR